MNLTEEKFPEYLYKLGTDPTKTTGQIYDELRERDQDLRKYLALAEASKDLETLKKGGVFVGRQPRDPLKGFLNLDRDLVIALRDHACLIWGAVDMGSNSSGDVMHFDCRLDDWEEPCSAERTPPSTSNIRAGSSPAHHARKPAADQSDRRLRVRIRNLKPRIADQKARFGSPKRKMMLSVKLLPC